jgi:hypothetical protein
LLRNEWQLSAVILAQENFALIVLLRLALYLPSPIRWQRRLNNIKTAWSEQYLQCHYERFDPVIARALRNPEPGSVGKACFGI